MPVHIRAAWRFRSTGTSAENRKTYRISNTIVRCSNIALAAMGQECSLQAAMFAAAMLILEE